MTESWIKIAFEEEVYYIPRPEEKQEKSAPQQQSSPEKIQPTASKPVIEPGYTNAASQEAIPPVPITYQGKNIRHILVLVPAAAADNDIILLQNILKAASHSLDDIALVHWNGGDPSPLLEQFSPEIVISFGLENDPWVAIDPYTVHLNGQIQHLRVDALPLIGNDTALKRRLWTNIQDIFNL